MSAYQMNGTITLDTLAVVFERKFEMEFYSTKTISDIAIAPLPDPLPAYRYFSGKSLSDLTLHST